MYSASNSSSRPRASAASLALASLFRPRRPEMVRSIGQDDASHSASAAGVSVRRGELGAFEVRMIFFFMSAVRILGAQATPRPTRRAPGRATGSSPSTSQVNAT
jgi:hypothetical protein